MDKNSAAKIGDVLRKSRQTLAIAESCTGGLVSSAVTAIPGSSDYFLGAVIAYSDRIKSSFLGVPKELLHRYGAVSPETALSLAVNVRKRSGSDYGLAVTGIAGPTGGSRTKPVGLVYIGLAYGRNSTVKKFIFKGPRSSVRSQAAQKALALLKEALLSEPGS